MDDFTSKRFDNLEQKIDGVEERLGKRIDGLEKKVDGAAERVVAQVVARVDTLAKGFEISLEALGAGIRAHFDAQQVETMKSLNDRRFESLEREVGDLRSMLLKLMGATKQ
jgi:hypothetical protein